MAQKEHKSAKETLAPASLGPSRVYKKVIKWLRDRGYYFRVNLESKPTSFHSLYEEHCPKDDPNTPKSIIFPEWFTFLVPAGELRLEACQELLLDEDIFSDFSEEEVAFARPLVIYKSGRATDITDHILGVEHLRGMRHKKMCGGKYELGIAHSPNTLKGHKKAVAETYAYTPERDWFDEKIRHLTFEDVIRIFPEHEAKMMKLIIGRACVGRTGSIHPGTNEPFFHGFRKAGVVVGEPGVGKTLTLNGILDAMRYVGYEVSNMGDFGSRFNQGNVITSHLSYNDDLTEETLERMLSAHSFKSVVTGGTEKVENKGVDAIEVVSNTVILANANTFRSEMVYSLDPGAVSRLAPISTFRLYELEERSEAEGHDLHPGSHIDYLCKQYDTDRLSLYLLVLRDCVDFFLEKCKEERDVHFYSEKLLPYMKIQLHKNAMECFLRMGFLAYAMRTRSGATPWLPELTLESFNDVIEALRFVMIDKRAHKLRDLLKEDWETNHRDPSHPYWAQRKMLITSIDRAFSVYNEQKKVKDVAHATEMSFDVLRLRDGFSMGKKMSYIVRTWESVKGEKGKIYRLAEKLMEKLPESDREVIKDTKLRADVKWIYSSDYDPQNV